MFQIHFHALTVTVSSNNILTLEFQQCRFASAQAGSLRRHLQTHSGEKPNKWNQCNDASAQAGNLMLHMKTPSTVK